MSLKKKKSIDLFQFSNLLLFHLPPYKHVLMSIIGYAKYFSRSGHGDFAVETPKSTLLTQQTSSITIHQNNRRSADVALRNSTIVSLHPLPTLKTRRDAWRALPQLTWNSVYQISSVQRPSSTSPGNSTSNRERCISLILRKARLEMKGGDFCSGE